MHQAADEQRGTSLTGQRGGAGQAPHLAVPDPAQLGEAVVEDLAVSLCRRAAGGEVVGPASDAEARGEPAAGDQVDRGELLGEQHRVVAPADVEDAGEQLDAFGHGGGDAERDQRVEDVVDEAVDRPQGVEADALALLRPPRELARRAPGNGVRQTDSDSHEKLHHSRGTTMRDVRRGRYPATSPGS
jgi:hypothetical protein